jgi:ABC-type Fe3+/spermidine/putrescine transport system ATPase subunit
MTQVTLDQLTKTYDNLPNPAVDRLSIEIARGAITALLGPSGSGKTTTLKMIAGLIEPSAGDIRFDDESVRDIPAERRSAVMVFQNHLLFPYMNVEQNIGFGLKMRGVDRKTIAARVVEMLELVRLPNIGGRRPHQLSGGQKQRVALARALVTRPQVLLLDEPLSSLDAHLRDEMRQLILDVQQQFEITTIFVTHDQQDAVQTADRIALLFDGRLYQHGPPVDFYRRPESIEVARFFGGVNVVPATCEQACVYTPIGVFEHEVSDSCPHGALMTIRPEQIQLAVGPNATNTCQGIIQQAIYGGTHMRYTVLVGDYHLEVVSSTAQPEDHVIGSTVTLHLPPEHIWLLPPA